MKTDINILPILTEYDEKVLNKLNLDSNYQVKTYGEDDFLQLSFGIALNGKPDRDYNIYIIINSYDDNNGRYDIFAGGFKVLSNRTYDHIIFKRTFIKYLKGMKRNMDLTIYKLPSELDLNNPLLKEGDFEEYSNINPDLELILNRGDFLSATTFKIVME